MSGFRTRMRIQPAYQNGPNEPSRQNGRFLTNPPVDLGIHHSMTTATAVARTVNVTPRIVADLVAIVGAENVLNRREEMLVYECDGYVVEKSVPDVVVFPTSTEQVVEVVKLCADHDVPFVSRGAGTSLAGGTLRVGGGVMICLA